MRFRYQVVPRRSVRRGTVARARRVHDRGGSPSSPFRELVDARDLALAAVTFYLGANLITHLVPDQSEVSRLLETARRFAPLFEPS
jgi:hypothetical protein